MQVRSGGPYQSQSLLCHVYLTICPEEEEKQVDLNKKYGTGNTKSAGPMDGLQYA